jgi:hypothetical protein
MLMSRHQNARQDHDIRIANRSFENMVHLKYFVTTVTNQYLIHGEINSRLNVRNDCYHLFQNPLARNLLFKNVKNKIHKTKNFACSFVWV